MVEEGDKEEQEVEAGDTPCTGSHPGEDGANHNKAPQKCSNDLKEKETKSKNQETCVERNTLSLVNLTHYTFSAAQINILSKGLSFVPKPKNVDQSDAERRLCKFRNQIVNIYEANYAKCSSAKPSHKDPTVTLPLTQTQGRMSTHGSHPPPTNPMQ